MPGFNLNLNLQFRRKRSGPVDTDETEFSLTCSIAIIVALVLAIMVATGVITPDDFARMRGSRMQLRPERAEAIASAAVRARDSGGP